MPKIQLFAIPVSTSCARTRIVLDHKAIPYTETPPPDGYASTPYKQIIPAGTVPGLMINDFALSDSAAQVELLEELYPQPPMLPKDPFARAKVRLAASFHDTRLEPSVRALFGLVKKTADRDSTAIAKGADLFRERLILLDSVINPEPFLGGEIFSHGDAAYPTTIYMGVDICATLDQPIVLSAKLTAWIQTLESIPAVQKNLELNRRAVANWIATKL